MEWWSNGVMKRIVRVEIGALAFPNTPILPYSSTPKPLVILTAKPLKLAPIAEKNQACYMEVKYPCHSGTALIC
jgi:hypothetical protein